jgi:PAS domain S-box-containing protein
VHEDRLGGYFLVTATPLHDESGQVIGSVHVARDITELKKAEAALRESDGRIRAICDMALDAMVMADASGKALYWNPAAERMFGYSSREMLGREIHDVLTPVRHRKQALEALSAFRASGQGRAVGSVLELTALRRDGSEFPIEISVSGFRMFDQWCAVAIIRDVTERKNAQRKLEQEQKALKLLLEASDHERQLIGYEIHDGLAQQLAGAMMQFEVFEFSKEKNSEQAATAHALGLQLIREANAEARRLIGGLRPPQLEEGGIIPALENLIQESNKRSKVKIEFCSNVPQVRLEPMLENTVFRIVQECITNAFRYSKSKKVKVELTQHDGQLHIEVQDWGIGFDVDRVREEHFGLEGIQERARVFGGSVSIKSQPHKGTNIVVDLPFHCPGISRDIAEPSRTAPGLQSDEGSRVRRPK